MQPVQFVVQFVVQFMIQFVVRYSCATIVVVDFINTHIPFSCNVRFGIMWDVSPVGLDPDSEWIFTVTETHFYVKVSYNFVTRFRS